MARAIRRWRQRLQAPTPEAGWPDSSKLGWSHRARSSCGSAPATAPGTWVQVLANGTLAIVDRPVKRRDPTRDRPERSVAMMWPCSSTPSNVP